MPAPKELWEILNSGAGGHQLQGLRHSCGCGARGTGVPGLENCGARLAGCASSMKATGHAYQGRACSNRLLDRRGSSSSTTGTGRMDRMGGRLDRMGWAEAGHVMQPAGQGRTCERGWGASASASASASAGWLAGAMLRRRVLCMDGNGNGMGMGMGCGRGGGARPSNLHAMRSCVLCVHAFSA